MPDAPQTMYHVATLGSHAGIAAHGLDALAVAAADEGMTAEAYREHWGHPGNWLWPTLADAQSYVRSGIDEIWQVDVSGLPLLQEFVTGGHKAYVCYETIPPERLRLLASD